jgi:sulfur carrier protein ThiS
MLSVNSQLPANLGRASRQSQDDSASSERLFCEFRRKVRDSELLSAAIEKLLRSLNYTGKLSVVVQNGEVLKSGYEEGYFRRRDDFSGLLE